MHITTRIESWPLAKPFRITGHVFTEAQVVVVEVAHDGFVGRGEACGAYYKGETASLMATQIKTIAERFAGQVIDTTVLMTAMQIGGALNALDCALWDLRAKRERTPVWQLARQPIPKPLRTTYTIGADEPDAMAKSAVEFAATALKLKLVGDGLDAERVDAVRAARPDCWLAVDANQGFSRQGLDLLIPKLVSARVALIEQPLRVGWEAELDGLDSPIPIAADESVQDVPDIARLVGRFDVINIKLDKCGGFTRALAMVDEARRHGLKVMVGNMGGTSLSMAPAFIVGQHCDVVDLDGPILLKTDRTPSATYEGGTIWCSDEVWGGPSMADALA